MSRRFCGYCSPKVSICRLCRDIKPLSEFGARPTRANPNAVRGECRSCRSGCNCIKCGKRYNRFGPPGTPGRAGGSTKICSDCCLTHWRCSTCKAAKLHSEFSYNAATAMGLNHECRDCCKEQSYRKLYGLAFGEYAQRLADQSGVCAICKDPPTEARPLHVDHDHKTGTVRSLLCHFCNVGLGHFRDDAQILSAAIDYVFEHASVIQDEDRNVRVPD